MSDTASHPDASNTRPAIHDPERETQTTMRIHVETAGRLAALLLAFALVGGAAPFPVQAQDSTQAQASSEETVDEEEMVHFVELQLEIDALQEEAIQEMVRIHSESGRATIRNNLTEAINEAHEAHGMTPERYKTITFLISSDTAVRELFEEKMAEAREGGGASAW